MKHNTYKVLMVCLGNICRSPLAEGILKSKIIDYNIDWEVHSAGTSDYHVGHPPHDESISIAQKYNLDISHIRSRPFKAKMFDQYDLILAMDTSNYRFLNTLSRCESDRIKTKLILNYLHPNRNESVPDPYYLGGFDHVFNLLDQACEKLIEKEIP